MAREYDDRNMREAQSLEAKTEIRKQHCESARVLWVDHVEPYMVKANGPKRLSYMVARHKL